MNELFAQSYDCPRQAGMRDAISTWLAKRRLQTVSLAEAAVGDRLTNMSALPSPDKQS